MGIHAGFGQNMHSRAHLQELQLGWLLANQGGGVPKLPHRGAWCVPCALPHTVQHVGLVYEMDRSMFSLSCIPTSMSASVANEARSVQCLDRCPALCVWLTSCVKVKGKNFEQKRHHLGYVAHHIHLCLLPRVSDQSHLAPHPRL